MSTAAETKRAKSIEPFLYVAALRRDFPILTQTVHGQHQPDQPVPSFQRRVDFPINEFASPRVASNQHDRAGTACNAFLRKPPPYVVRVVAVDCALERGVVEDFVLIAESPREGVVIGAIATMMVADEDFAFRL